MSEFRSLTLRSAAIAALTLLASGSHAQGSAGGRALFDKNGCAQCHAYVARSAGSSVRDLMKRFKGAPEKTVSAINAAKDHASDPQFGAVSRADMRLIAAWLAGDSAAQTASQPDGQKSPAASQKPQGTAEGTARREAETKAKSNAEAKAAAKRDALEQAKREAEAKVQAKRDAEVKAKQEAEGKALAKRDAELKAKREADAQEFAKREAEAKSKKDGEALAALKREAEERAKRDAEAKAKLEAETQALAKREAEERTRREAEAKARKEAEAQAALKREADERAKREAEAKTRKDADSPAPTKRRELAYKDGSELPPCPPPSGQPIPPVDEERAKSIIDRVGCPQCHAYVQKKTGPPFKKVFDKYKGDPECVISRLKKNKEHNEEGVTDDIKPPEFKIIADYIATRAK